MSQGFIGEIRLFAGDYPPQGWATCDGQLISINDNNVLYSLIGTTYGGDGQSTFGLPNLAARTPIHIGSNGANTYSLAANGGVTNVTLTTAQLPAHRHSVNTTASGQQVSPAGTFPAPAFSSQSNVSTYGAGATPVALHQSSVGVQGGSQPHDNMQPYMPVTYIIALVGVYPSQN